MAYVVPVTATVLYAIDWHKTCLDIKCFLNVKEHWTRFIVSDLPLHPQLTIAPQPSHALCVDADAMTGINGRHCLLLPAKWKPTVPTPSPLTFNSSTNNVMSIQRSCNGLQAIFVGGTETLLKQTGSFHCFSADFCLQDLQFNHSKCQCVLFLADPQSSHSSKGKRNALLT